MQFPFNYGLGTFGCNGCNGGSDQNCTTDYSGKCHTPLGPSPQLQTMAVGSMTFQPFSKSSQVKMLQAYSQSRPVNSKGFIPKTPQVSSDGVGVL